MPLIDSASAPVFTHEHARFTGLAAPSRGATENAVWRLQLAPRSPGLPHQVSREEVFVATRGTAHAVVAGQLHVLSEGSALVVPPRTTFSLANPGDEPFEAVVVLPVGAHALVEGQAPFVPPWAQ